MNNNKVNTNNRAGVRTLIVSAGNEIGDMLTLGTKPSAAEFDTLRQVFRDLQGILEKFDILDAEQS